MYSQYNPNAFYGGGNNQQNMNNMQPQRLSQSKNYKRPNKTIQDSLSNKDIKEKLKSYISVDTIDNVQLGTHVRYYSKNIKTGEIKFRLGGTLVKRDLDKPYVILSNGSLSWSVQKKTSKFYRKMSTEEEKEHILNDVRKLRDKFTEKLVEKDTIIEDNIQEISKLRKRLDRYHHD
tara:strand:+ start:1102 stop:1629 length:528 start_codon:yes stop_codon:yes gene_type:complete